MSYFKSEKDAENAINKFMPIILGNLGKFYSVNMNLTPTGSEDEYYGDLTFIVNGDSFTQKQSDALMSSRGNIVKNLKKYLGIKVIINQTSVTTKK